MIANANQDSAAAHKQQLFPSSEVSGHPAPVQFDLSLLPAMPRRGAAPSRAFDCFAQEAVGDVLDSSFERVAFISAAISSSRLRSAELLAPLDMFRQSRARSRRCLGRLIIGCHPARLLEGWNLPCVSRARYEERTYILANQP